MNILLVCAAGMSTSLLVTKMEQSAKKLGDEVEIFAFTGNNIIVLHAQLNISTFIFHLPPE